MLTAFTSDTSNTSALVIGLMGSALMGNRLVVQHAEQKVRSQSPVSKKNVVWEDEDDNDAQDNAEFDD